MILVHIWWVITSATNWFYAIVSGWGADLGLVAGAVVFYRNKKCAKCFRFAHHDVAGTHYRTCHHHTTIADHYNLQKRHEREWPKMNQLLNRGKKT